MNKAFVREPDSDASVRCPRCGNLATEIGRGPLDLHMLPEHRRRLGDSAWCCGSVRCNVVYFDVFDQSVCVEDLRTEVYPYCATAPMCACFGLTLDDIEQDIREGQPVRIRELLKRSQTADAACRALALNGECCVKEVQRVYLKLRGL